MQEKGKEPLPEPNSYRKRWEPVFLHLVPGGGEGSRDGAEIGRPCACHLGGELRAQGFNAGQQDDTGA